MEVKETVEQAAKEYIGFDQHGKWDQGFISGAEFGANWQKENSIDRDKVIAVFENEIKRLNQCSERQRVNKNQVQNILTDLLQVIKQMK